VRRFDKNVIVSTHPRTRQRLDALPRTADLERIRFVPPFAFTDYVRLQQAAFCVVSDSGTLTEEASLLGIPGVMIRDAHERPEGMDEGTVVMTGLASERVLAAVALVTSQLKQGFRPRRVADYDAPDVSRKVVRIVLSYVDYVNRTVWRQ
jgi:UDP-N-acetylglucosamine 2-epimerase (non-hydrolysing)